MTPTRSIPLLAAWLLGCGAPQPIFEPLAEPIVWPQPPEPPRFSWVGAIGGEADLKRPRGFWESFLGFVVGADPLATFRSAHGVAVTPSGVLYVSDPQGGVVHRLDLDTREYRAITEIDGGRRLATPIGLALAGDRLAVADRSLRTVAFFTPEGELDRSLDTDSLAAPVDVAVAPSGRVVVTDVTEHEVEVFESDGRPAFKFGKRGVGPGEFNFPTHVACDADERIYVSDSLNARIQVFDSGGGFLRTVGHRGDSPGQFSQPKGIACDDRGLLYAVDAHFENVQIFGAGGELLLAIGREGTGPGEFWLPVGVFVDHEDRVWVADSFNRRVQVFQYLENLESDPGIP